MGIGGERPKPQSGVWSRRRGWEWGRRGQGCAGWLEGERRSGAAPSAGSSPPGKTPARAQGGGMSPKQALLVVPTGLLLMGCQVVPKGFARLWDPQEEPPPKWPGALHPPASSALAAPALTQAWCRGQPGTAALSLNCCSSVALAAPAPSPVQRRSCCWGSPSVPGGTPGRGPAHRAQEPTGTVHTRTQGWDRQTPVLTHLQAPSSPGCRSLPGTAPGTGIQQCPGLGACPAPMPFIIASLGESTPHA